MARRNSLRKLRAHHEAVLKAEACRDSAKVKRKQQWRDRAEAEQLAGELERLVQVSAETEQARNESKSEVGKEEGMECRSVIQSSTISQNLNGTSNKKKSLRRKMTKDNSKKRNKQDIDMMEDGDAQAELPGMKLLSCGNVCGKSSKIVKKSLAKRRREERKLKLKLLLWEGAGAAYSALEHRNDA